MNSRKEEVSHKINLIRNALKETGATGVYLRGTDWFAWATAGGSNTVLLAAETGVAEILVTADHAWILTDEIEAQRLIDEELTEVSDCYQLQVNPWAEYAKREAFINAIIGTGKLLSDRPIPSESSLPKSLIDAKRVLLPTELDRYRQVGKLASQAITEVLTQAQPNWTEYQLAGAGAEALWARGLQPALTLAAGERRLPLYRHPTPSHEAIGQLAMLVFCARGFGLIASLTRFVCFGKLSEKQTKLHRQVREVEAAGLNACQIGTPLNQVYNTLKQAYEQQGYPRAIEEHHQGGTAGYLAREIVANPLTDDRLRGNMAIAWNPSLPGSKIEDTFVLREDGSLENLTLDSSWTSVVEVAGRLRPLPLEV
jgi:Xaa-Pro aminopeptidase